MPIGIYKRTEEHNRKNSEAHKGQIPWIKGKKHSEESKQKMSKNSKGEKHYFWSKIHSKETKRKNSEAHKDNKNCNWKGDKAGSRAIHKWVEERKGKANSHKCKCGRQARHWSNKDHKYRRILDDYTAMCSKCHKIYDIKNN